MIHFLYQYSGAFCLGALFGGSVMAFLVDRIYRNSFFYLEQKIQKERNQ